MKRTIKIIALLAAVFLLLFGSAFLFLYFNKGKVIRIFTQEINKSLEARMDVRNIDLSLKKFPMVSIALEAVTCFEPVPESTDTLFSFQQVHFQFGLWDLLRGKYDLQKIDFDNGMLQIRDLPNGKPNYIIWKEEPEATTSDFELDLQKVIFNKTDVRYTLTPETQIRAHLELLQFSGHFDNVGTDLSVKATGLLSAVVSDNENLLKSQLPVQVSVAVTSDANAIRMPTGQLVLNETSFYITGFSNAQQKHWEVKTNEASPGALLAFVPERFFNAGTLPQTKGKISGLLQYDQEGQKPATLVADFSLRQGEIKLPDWPQAFQNIAAEGRYFSDGKVEKFQLTDLQLQYAGFSLSGKGAVTDFKRPKLNVQLQANGPAAAAYGLMGASTDYQLAGTIKLQANFSNNYANWDAMQQHPLANASLSGQFDWWDGAFNSQELHLDATAISTTLRLESHAILIDKLHLVTQQSEVQFTGKVAGGLDALLDDKKPWHLTGKLLSNQLHISEWLRITPPENETPPSAPSRNTVALSLDIKKFQYENFIGTHLGGEFLYSQKGFEGRNWRFNALSGTAQSSFLLEDLGKTQRFTNQSTLTNINIQQLFQSFDNFGQEALTAKNITGVGNCDLRFTLDFDEHWQPDVTTLVLQSDLVIQNGRLVDFTPLENLSKFVAISELQDVRFATLSNVISIQNQIITIPEMTITSSAIELGLAGTHSFENQVDYSVRLKQRDLLGSKKRTKNIDEWIVEADRPGESFLWVRISGDFDNLVIGLDKEKNRAAVRSGWEQQSQELKDKTKKTGEKRQGGELIFEWDD